MCASDQQSLTPSPLLPYFLYLQQVTTVSLQVLSYSLFKNDSISQRCITRTQGEAYLNLNKEEKANNNDWDIQMNTYRNFKEPP